MELEFDNEIDALLRKARDDRGVTVGDTLKLHLDADEIAAFAENAIPDSAKRSYMAHFADCDGCRKTLSSVILLNSEAGTETAPAVAAPVVAENVVPWYKKLFLFPNIAYVMGSLVLVFSGFLAVSVLKNSDGRASSEVSQISENEPTASGPHVGLDEGYYSNSNSPAANAANTAANTTASTANSAANVPAAPDPAFAANTSAQPADAKNQPPAISSDGIATSGDAPASAAQPPAPAPKERQAENDDRIASAEEKRAVLLKDADKLKAEGKVMQEQAPLRGPMQVQKGPSRNEQRNDARARDSELAAKRSAKPDSDLTANRRQAGGRTFEYKQGVWYDPAYRGQATTNVRRGTDAYKKLDGGLRSIGEAIPGTVVVVWKDKAYRID